MGLLLLISPPGYGKTTLMEYVANRLGLVFMKVNGPALGHEVTSIDPADAPNATAREEVEKVNLALEMGNNVMLYLDDIQHTNPEFCRSSSRCATRSGASRACGAARRAPTTCAARSSAW
jgi:MoxR-like ATPase